MAEGIVDCLEAVDVEDEHAEGPARRERGIEALLERGDAGAAVERLGERVEAGLLGEGLLGPLALRHVEGGPEDGRLALELDHAGGEVDPDLGAVLAEELDLVALGYRLAALPGHAALADQVAEVGVDDIPEVHAEQLGARIAGDFLRCRVDVLHALALEDERGGGYRLGHGAELRLALAQGLLGALPLRDIRRDTDEARDFAVRPAHRGVVRLQDDAVDLDRRGAGVTCQRRACPLDDLGEVLVHLEHGLTHHLTGLQAERLQAPALGQGDRAVAVDGEEDDGRVGDDGAQPLLALAQGLLGALAFRDVAGDADDAGDLAGGGDDRCVVRLERDAVQVDERGEGVA